MIMSAIWVKDHYFLGTFYINFGGPHFYNFHIAADHLKISRTKNDQFISNFYTGIPSTKGNLHLVSAIVGNNGSGKSTICSIIRAIANSSSTPDSYLEFDESIVIYEDILGDTYALRQITREGGVDIYLNKEKVMSSSIILDFDVKINENALHQSTIFYSPFLDNNALYLDFLPSDLDVSLQNTLYKDKENAIIEESHILAEHYYKNLDRHYALMNSNTSKSLVAIGLPVYDDAWLELREVSMGKPSNLSSDFTSAYSMLYEKCRSEIRSVQDRLHGKEDVVDRRELVMFLFYRSLITTIFKCINSTHKLLTEAFFNAEADWYSMTLEGAFEYFLGNHLFKQSSSNFINLEKLPQQEIENFLQEARRIINDTGAGNFSSDMKFRASFNSVSALLNAQRLFLHAMKPIGEISGFITAAPGIELSSGEKAMFDLFSRFYDIREEALDRFNEGSNSLLTIILDEADIGFHPQWKKKYLINVIKVLPAFFDEKGIKVQIIFTTHDPLTLSDIPNYNVVYLKKMITGDKSEYRILHQDDEDEDRPKHSFGANITQMYLNSFFIEDGLVGEFAKEKIDATIKWLNGSDKVTPEDKEYHRKIIELIGEPLLKSKLSEMYTTRVKDNSLELKVIGERIKRLEDLRQKMNNDQNRGE